MGTGQPEVFRGYEVGAVDYLTKPFSPDILRAKVAVFVDLFKLRNQLQRQFEESRRLNRELEASNRELEAFGYSVSHDLRAPLRSIEGFSQALLEDYGDKLDEQGRDSLWRVRAATQRMGQLIDDLLHLSRVTMAELRREVVDVTALVRSVTESLLIQHPQRKIEIVIAENVEARADSKLLRVALENLLVNAFKFTSKTPAARVEFGAYEGKERQRVYFVRDNGAGFDMTFASRLFAAFQRLHSPSEFAGTGIGLATVQRIIHRHGGRIWAEAAVNKGAAFYFTLEPGES
jgi:light-regulated signal transduction histidine kinase (bacteriophytochrome)